ncbi:MAG: DUF58 domain-containing protein [Magnetococcales bacterium]|nr:DUF58 domain-containing protein [Magnetococcales bacterium]
MFHKLLWRGAGRLSTWSHWLSRSLTPMGKGVTTAAFVAAVFGINTELSLVYQVFSLLFSLLLFSILSARSSRVILEGARILPDQVWVGQPFDYELLLLNPSGVAYQDVVIFEQFPDPRPGFDQFMRTRNDPEERMHNFYDRWVGLHRFVRLTRKNLGIRNEMHALGPIAPHGELRVRLRATATRRGVIHFSGLLIGRADPLGLLRSFHHCPLPGRVLAVPRCHSVPHFEDPRGRKHVPGGLTMAAAVGEHNEIAALRSYRAGDRLHAIHWPGLAKTGKLVVVERQEEFFTRHALVLDTLASVSDAVFEEAVSLTASLALAEGHPDTLLEFMFVGPEVFRCTTGRGLGDHRRILELLASVQPQVAQPFATLAQLVVSQAPRLSALFVVLIHWDRDRELWLHALRARGIPLRVFLIQEEQPSPSSMALPGKGVPGFHLLHPGMLRHGFKGTS